MFDPEGNSPNRTRPTLDVVIPARYRDASMAANTRASYDSAWKVFRRWCDDNSRVPLPADPQTVVDFLAHEADAGKKASTINSYLCALSFYHREADHDEPKQNSAVRKLMRGIRRKLGTRPDQKAPLLPHHLISIRAVVGNRPLDVRNWAVVVMNLAGGFRISEIVGLQMEDLTFDDYGVRVLVNRSKTDQNGRGMVKFIGLGEHGATCPVQALQNWLKLRGLLAGKVFCHVDKWGNAWPTDDIVPRAMYRILTGIFRKAGLPKGRFSPHSCRAGFVTSARAAGLDDKAIMSVTGHKAASTLAIYDRRPQEQINTTKAIGL